MRPNRKTITKKRKAEEKLERDLDKIRTEKAQAEAPKAVTDNKLLQNQALVDSIRDDVREIEKKLCEFQRDKDNASTDILEITLALFFFF